MILMYCDAVTVSLCNETVKVSLCSFVFAKRPERPCISLELLYSHWCMKGSPVLRTFVMISLMFCDAVTVSFCRETG